jgi:retinol dehydrogenase 12
MELSGRRVVITGANTGIGRAAAVDLARRGAELWLLNRSEDRSQEVLHEIRAFGGAAHLVLVDLEDLASVGAAADRVLSTIDRVDVLINNAGLAGSGGTSPQGFERTFAVNHLGHFLLTQRLLPVLHSEVGPARIVNVASAAHYSAKGIDWDALRKPTPRVFYDAYAVSKLANVLFARELSRRLPVGRAHAYALHPGVVATDVWRWAPQPLRWLMTRFMVPVVEGAATTLHCAASPASAGESGLYYDESKVRRPSRLADDPELARELWERSEAWVSGF